MYSLNYMYIYILTLVFKLECNWKYQDCLKKVPLLFRHAVSPRFKLANEESWEKNTASGNLMIHVTNLKSALFLKKKNVNISHKIQLEKSFFWVGGGMFPIGSMYGIYTYIWLILNGKCRYICHRGCFAVSSMTRSQVEVMQVHGWWSFSGECLPLKGKMLSQIGRKQKHPKLKPIWCTVFNVRN